MRDAFYQMAGIIVIMDMPLEEKYYNENTFENIIFIYKIIVS